MMGQGDTGQLGLGEQVSEKKKPFPVGGVLEGLRVVQVVCGGMHTAALTDDGKVGVAFYMGVALQMMSNVRMGVASHVPLQV